MDDGLTIQQVAQRTGLSIDTLRYYERLGLLISVRRLSNGHRRYDESDLRWIDLLKCLRASAMPLNEMQRFAEMTRQGISTVGERRELLQAHRLRVVAQLQETQQTLARLDTKIAHLHAVETEEDTEKAGARFQVF
jgi:DNA-binding transcriptional MerR regulator